MNTEQNEVFRLPTLPLYRFVESDRFKNLSTAMLSKDLLYSPVQFLSLVPHTLASLQKVKCKGF